MRFEEQQLHAFLDRALPPPLSREIRRDASESTEQCLGELQALNGWVDAQFGLLTPTEAPDSKAAFGALQQKLDLKSPLLPEGAPASWWEQWRRSFQWALTAVAACAMMLFSLRDAPSPKPSVAAPIAAPQTPMFTRKGRKNLYMYHAHRYAHGVLAFAPAGITSNGDVLYPGDLVQFAYEFKQPKHVMVVSLNEKGELFAFVPLQGTQSIKVDAGEGTLPDKRSLLLDQYRGVERFFLIASSKPFRFDSLKAPLRKQWHPKHLTRPGTQTRYPSDWDVLTLWIRKQKRPPSLIQQGPSLRPVAPRR